MKPLLVLAALAGLAGALRADDAPVATDLRPNPPMQAAPGELLVTRGFVGGSAPATLVLRVDDGASVNYASRVNEERLPPPGPFVWRFPLAGAKTSRGGLIDARDIRRLSLFEPTSEKRIQIAAFGLEPAPKLPEGVAGYSFGAADAPLIGGLTRIAPGDPRIVNGHPQALRRPGPDPVGGNGLAGIEKIKLPWPRGRAHVSLFIEDVGEWESLPHALQRRIRVNGGDLLYRWLKPQEWIAARYLAGRDREAGPQDDAWTAYGRHRGDVISGDVAVGDDGIVIEVAGEGAAATFLSAVVLEPAGQTAGIEAVQAARRDWMRENFPVLPTPPDAAPTPLFGPEVAQNPPSLRVVAARGTGGRLSFSLFGGGLTGRPKITLSAPALGDTQLGLELYARQPRLDRVSTNSTLLQRTDDFLRGDAENLPVRPDEPRRYLAWARAPENAPPGLYRGSVSFDFGTALVEVPLEVEVLPVDLPPVASPAGFYLDEAPHLDWFEATRGQRGRQLDCDLAVLNAYGVLGDAPALGTPDRAGLAGFLDDERRAQQAGVAAPWLAYSSLKRLIALDGLDAAAVDLRRAQERAARAGLPAPIWALFDEPANMGGDTQAAAAAEKLRAAAPGLKLAGQFNEPDDWRYLRTVDVAIVNPGFGVDAATIAQVKARGREAWLYNTGAPRFTAGLWLWTTGATRYIEWHARMPTADPYDPTDGREGDVQVFAPGPEICAARPDINLALIGMAEGLVDQRWLLWLSRRTEPEARALAADIRGQLAGDWASASRDGAAKAERMRASLIDLARRLPGN